MPIHEGIIPAIEGFQPIPNSVMIPFMEAQSAALAFAFGLNYEYGKRTVRSMSNDKFNSLTSEQISQLSTEHTEIILKDFINAVPKVMPAQRQIFDQYVEIEKAKVLQNVALKKWIISNAPQILAEGKAADTASDIREDTSRTGDRLAIGTVTSQGVIIGYINGVPQYKAVPQEPTSRRPSTPRTPTLPAQQQAEKSLIEKMLVSQKVIIDKIKATATHLNIILANINNIGPTSFLVTMKNNDERIIKRQNELLRAASLNLNKKQQQYKNKYGVWLF